MDSENEVKSAGMVHDRYSEDDEHDGKEEAEFSEIEFPLSVFQYENDREAPDPDEDPEHGDRYEKLHNIQGGKKRDIERDIITSVRDGYRCDDEEAGEGKEGGKFLFHVLLLIMLLSFKNLLYTDEDRKKTKETDPFHRDDEFEKIARTAHGDQERDPEILTDDDLKARIVPVGEEKKQEKNIIDIRTQECDESDADDR